MLLYATLDTLRQSDAGGKHVGHGLSNDDARVCF
jgi:hypothetical protein